EAALGRKIGNRAALAGGIVATLPDLDSFIPYDDAVATFTYHRSATHSLFVLAAASPLITWLALKLQPKFREFRKETFQLVFLALFTHPLLDAFTVYGTQLFWPITNYPVSGSTIFIVDPLYTIWLLIGCISAMLISRDKITGHRLNYAGLALSSIYLSWTVAAKLIVDNRAEQLLNDENIAFDQLMSTPAPFTSFTWRLIGKNREGYFDAFIDVFGEDQPVIINQRPSEEHLLVGLRDHWPVTRLLDFTHGYYSVSRRGDDILITDLRMGLESNYVFVFKVAKYEQGFIQPVTSVLAP
ncbi:MAG: metal-dependent hydrolase, partial [Gammaproteobacteria bacterium]|nr:metal-dependent hydrolase [Gammaproteobacteria bacterium]